MSRFEDLKVGDILRETKYDLYSKQSEISYKMIIGKHQRNSVSGTCRSDIFYLYSFTINNIVLEKIQMGVKFSAKWGISSRFVRIPICELFKD